MHGDGDDVVALAEARVWRDAWAQLEDTVRQLLKSRAVAAEAKRGLELTLDLMSHHKPKGVSHG